MEADLVTEADKDAGCHSRIPLMHDGSLRTSPNVAEPALVTFSHVDKTYDGEIYIIKDLNFDVMQGEFLSLLGPSGSGKTTTLMMLAGFEAPSSGEIKLDGKDVTHIPSWRRNIGVVFQNYALFPHMTVAKNVAFPLRMRRVPNSTIQRKVGAAL